LWSITFHNFRLFLIYTRQIIKVTYNHYRVSEVVCMSESGPLRCQKCGKAIGYVTVTAKSFIAAKPTVDNVKLVAICMDCSSQNGFYRRNF
jgi:hypothetical protein